MAFLLVARKEFSLLSLAACFAHTWQSLSHVDRFRWSHVKVAPALGAAFSLTGAFERRPFALIDCIHSLLSSCVPSLAIKRPTGEDTQSSK